MFISPHGKFVYTIVLYEHIFVLHNENHTFSFILKWFFIFLQIPFDISDFCHVMYMVENIFSSVRFGCGLICISVRSKNFFFFSSLFFRYNKHIYDSKMFIIILEINNGLFLVRSSGNVITFENLWRFN